MSEQLKIPPRGRTNFCTTWHPVPHGVDVLIEIRRLDADAMSEEAGVEILAVAFIRECADLDLDPCDVLDEALTTPRRELPD